MENKEAYTLLKVISSGSHGVVYKGRNNSTGEIVAIKQEFQGMSQSTLREIGILTALPPHPSIVDYKGLVKGDDGRVFVVMEYLPTDLYRLMDAKKEPFTLSEVKLVMKKLLEGIDFLHHMDVMHRDLKPENILLNTGCTIAQLKICDFGLSRIYEKGSGSFTPEVCTLWYRAPEVLLGEGKYTKAIDMWSIGCIMAELVSNDVLFPGDSELQQSGLIWNTPWDEIRRKMGEAASFQKGPLLTDSGYDFLRRLLSIDPEKRITAKDALSHNWFNEYYGLYP